MHPDLTPNPPIAPASRPAPVSAVPAEAGLARVPAFADELVTRRTIRDFRR
ncbi:hypothetical protein AB0873_11070 [Micromonospora sp. NPDC047707]|uniref:hypothetical protein n=1 Tax=unclassified Micromonospora TaxID=2617518 RepID=UPI0012B4F5CF|nr:hypothetical protein [Micromonospora sp. WMMC415]QGN46299.1 hypothetical protein GKC29_05225 [Micromonospora sp. WMMC415]